MGANLRGVWEHQPHPRSWGFGTEEPQISPGAAQRSPWVRAELSRPGRAALERAGTGVTPSTSVAAELPRHWWDTELSFLRKSFQP